MQEHDAGERDNQGEFLWIVLAQAGVVEGYDPRGEDNGEQGQADHDDNGKVKRSVGNMPGGFFVSLTYHVVREDGDEGRTERSASDDGEDEVGYKKRLVIGIGGTGCTENVGEHRGAEQAEYAAGDECA